MLIFGEGCQLCLHVCMPTCKVERHARALANVRVDVWREGGKYKKTQARFDPCVRPVSEMILLGKELRGDRRG